MSLLDDLKMYKPTHLSYVGGDLLVAFDSKKVSHRLVENLAQRHSTSIKFLGHQYHTRLMNVGRRHFDLAELEKMIKSITRVKFLETRYEGQSLYFITDKPIGSVASVLNTKLAEEYGDEYKVGSKTILSTDTYYVKV